jgi:hypothetical protein
MDQSHFPWRQLGTVLVEEGLVARRDLEEALEEQRQTGRLLGQILVRKGAVTGVKLARALAKQHGVELRQADVAVADQVVAAGAPERSESAGRWDRPWKPLGKVLVENGLVSHSALLDALVEKGRHPDRRLGEILVGSGHLTGAALASALAEQHGLTVETAALDAETETVTVPVEPGRPSYHVCAVTHVLGGEKRTLLYEGPNLLDAADFACDYIDREEPDAVEIDRYDPDGKETVWAYSLQRAVAAAEEKKGLVDTFGFDPARWNVPSS